MKIKSANEGLSVSLIFYRFLIFREIAGSENQVKMRFSLTGP